MLAAYDAQLGTQQEVAQMFGVGRQCLSELLRQRRRTGTIIPRHGGGHPPAFRGKKLQKLRDLVQQQPDITLAELRARTGVACSLVAVHYTLRRLDLRFKKKSLHASEQDRPDVAGQRQAWRGQTAELDLTHLVFVDETGAKTNMTRRYGRAQGGQRVVDSAPHGHWATRPSCRPFAWMAQPRRW